MLKYSPRDRFCTLVPKIIIKLMDSLVVTQILGKFVFFKTKIMYRIVSRIPKTALVKFVGKVFDIMVVLV